MRLIELVHFSDEQLEVLNPVGMVVGMYQEDVFTQLKALPIMSHQFGWARGITDALGMYIHFLQVYCRRQDASMPQAGCEWRQPCTFSTQAVETHF